MEIKAGYLHVRSMSEAIPTKLNVEIHANTMSRVCVMCLCLKSVPKTQCRRLYKDAKESETDKSVEPLLPELRWGGGAEGHGALIKTTGWCSEATAFRDCESSFLARLVGGLIATSAQWRARLSLLQARGFLG